MDQSTTSSRSTATVTDATGNGRLALTANGLAAPSIASNADVNAIVARCLLEPPFLHRLMHDPATALAEYSLDERARADFLAMDLAEIRRFAGFITKVQHNDLWKPFPHTRSLLHRYGIELDLFAAYHDTHQRLRQRGASKSEKFKSFVAFLLAYLDEPARASYVALRDLVLHEQMRWDVKSEMEAAPLPPPDALPSPLAAAPATALWRAVPVVRGALRIESFTLDPIAIIATLAQRSTDFAHIPRYQRFLACWGDVSAQQLHTIEIDRFSALLLSEVNGKRSLRTIARRVSKAGSGLSPADVLPFFRGALRQGLLTTIPDRRPG